MGLIALILSVVVDAIWPLRGRGVGRADTDELTADPFDVAAGPGVGPGAGTGPAAMDAPDGDLIEEPPYDPVADAAAPAAPASSRPAVTVAPHPLQRHALWLAGLLAPG